MEKEPSIENLDQSNPVENSRVPMNKQVDEEHVFGAQDVEADVPQRKKRREDLPPPVQHRDDIQFDDDIEEEVSRYKINQASDNKISGCLFGYIGAIVLGFGIFLIKKGKNSERFLEIEEYVSDVNVSKRN